MVAANKTIALNFFPLRDQRFHFQVFRKPYDQAETDTFRDDPGMSCYRLPDGPRTRRTASTGFPSRPGVRPLRAASGARASIVGQQLLFGLAEGGQGFCRILCRP